jgi:type VI protein secretion system component VasF
MVDQTGSPAGPEAISPHSGKWKRRRRSFLRRIFRRTTLIMIGAIAVAVVVLYFLLQTILSYREPDV